MIAQSLKTVAKRNNMRLHSIFFYLVFTLFILACSRPETDGRSPETSTSNKDHPFLIVKKEQYDDLRQKSASEPWKSMKADAIARSKATIKWGNSNSQNAYNLQYYVGAAALAYILDESDAQKHAHRVRDAILNHYAKLNIQEGGDWGGVVPPMGSFFVAILSLDIVYDALSEEEISQCEKVISDQIFKINRTGAWEDVRYGTHGTWDIYKGDRTEPDDPYYDGVMFQVTEDGVSPVTTHYAWERVGGGDSRVSKSGYMDVLEFTGIDRRYYNNERLQKFYRWLFGSSINTAKEMAIIGDMLPTQGIGDYLLHRRVVNFDMEAAAYAAWYNEGAKAKGHIITYIIPKQALPPPKVPESQIYPNGGAFFREKPDDPNGMHAVLYNIKSQDEWHTHNEVNGLALSGYGVRLLVNGGRLGAPTRPAFYNNTLIAGGHNHDSRLGGGIIEGFTTNEFDYALGFSGPALRNAKHDRSLILLHAADGAQAYFVLFDEVEADVGEPIKNYLHPANQTSVAAVVEKQEYTAKIDHYPTVDGVSLAFFYATPPQEVVVSKAPSAIPERYPDYPDHNRLQSVYHADENGRKNMITVLFPYKGSRPKGTFSRLEDDDFTGGTIAQQGGITDYIFESMGEKLVTHKDLVFQAKAAIFRQMNEQAVFYFVKEGTNFQYKNVGFEADVPLTIYAKDNEGALVSPGAKVRLKGAGLDALNFEPSATILRTGADFVEVELGEGVFYFH